MTGGRGFTWDERLAALALLVDGVVRVRRTRIVLDTMLLLIKNNKNSCPVWDRKILIQLKKNK